MDNATKYPVGAVDQEGRGNQRRDREKVAPGDERDGSRWPGTAHDDVRTGPGERSPKDAGDTEDAGVAVRNVPADHSNAEP